MTGIAIIVGSTRPGRKADTVARWVHEQARHRTDATFEVLDLLDFGLPLLDEELPAMAGDYAHAHTRRWAEAVESFDGFVFVTPEYNHSTSGALKNAIDFLYSEWNDKAAGFVSYGVDGGVRAVEHLRQVVGELKVADVRAVVSLTFADDFTGWTDFTPAAAQNDSVSTMLDEVITWSAALRPLRAGARV